MMSHEPEDDEGETRKANFPVELDSSPLKSSTLPPPPSPGKETDLLSESDLLTLVHEVSMISSQWIYLGMALGLTQESLMDIRAMKPADSQYFLSMMFMQWLQHTQSPTWSRLVEALRSPMIEENDLADQLEKKYCHGSDWMNEVLPAVNEVLPAVDDSPLGEDDFFDLQEQMVPVIAGWYTIGLGLRLHIEILKAIEMDCSSPMECMDKVLKSWLRRRYNVRRFGEPTWRTLVQVVAHPAAGNNPKLALEIAGKHLGAVAQTEVLTSQPPSSHGSTTENALGSDQVEEVHPTVDELLPTVEEVLPTVDDSPLEQDDLFDLLEQMLPVFAKWKAIGLGLRLQAGLLEQIEVEHSSPRGRMVGVLTQWLRGNYNMERFGLPSWRLLLNAVAHPAAGDNLALALEIARKHPATLSRLIPDSSPPISPTPPTSPSLGKEKGSEAQREVLSPQPSSSCGSTTEDAPKYSDLEFTEIVGKGGYGTVWKGKWKSKNMIVAIKKVDVCPEIEREIKILSKLNHPCVIRYFGTVEELASYFIVTEFAENGSIYDYIHKERKQVSPDLGLKWLRQVAQGMVCLHEQDIIHRDLKSSNVVLTSTLDGKIVDLGSARTLVHPTKQSTIVGTYAWMAPEMVRRESVSKSCDVYSYGIVLWEIITLQVPFSDVKDYEIPLMVAENKHPAIPENCESHLADLMRRCWQEPKARPSFEDILEILD